MKGELLRGGALASLTTLEPERIVAKTPTAAAPPVGPRVDAAKLAEKFRNFPVANLNRRIAHRA